MANFNRKTRIIEENMIFPPKKKRGKKKTFAQTFSPKKLYLLIL